MSENCETILGLDIGTNSIGWALLSKNTNNGSFTIIDAGVRVFEAGMEGDIAEGKAESRCATRREKRQVRRQLARHRKRLARIRKFLTEKDFFPETKDFPSMLAQLDSEIKLKLGKLEEYSGANSRILHHNFLYILRKRALDFDLEKHEFGRLMYHLAQRRGFLGLRTGNENEEEKGEVKKGISELQKAINDSGARTLGEYFASLDPEQTRIRQRWTARQMYIDEFNLICKRQQSILKEDPTIKKTLFNLIFYQRPLTSKKGLIGTCILEDGQKRCPWNREEAQLFRIYQTLNNLKVIEANKIERELSSEERQSLLSALLGNTGDLDSYGHLNISKAKKITGLPKSSKFSIEEGGEKKLVGHIINAKLVQVFGNEWFSMDKEKQESILQDLRSYTNTEALKRRAMSHWQLDDEKATIFSETILPIGYCSLSLKAIKKLLPDLEAGIPYSTAVKFHYPEHFKKTSEPLSKLPRLEEALGNLRNPVVSRSLTETRKLVNAILAKYGKPDFINIELAREMKNSKKEKERIVKKQRENESKREKAAKLIFEQLRISEPSRQQIEKVLLWEECNKICPYTQKTISLSDILGPVPQFDIEHIIPFSRSLDDSFANKTLCEISENRNVKKNKTPFEAYSSNKDKYDKILESVKKFDSPYAKEKLRRFQMTPEEVENQFQDFSSRQLNDTRYATVEAMKYLSLLYGGIVDNTSRRRINAVGGGITYIVRTFLGLNKILGDGVKNRDDHRHHAVDAIAIALTTPSIIQQISSIAAKLEKEQLFDRKRFRATEIHESYKNLYEKAKEKIQKIITSHRVSKRLRGGLHEDSFYGRTKEDNLAKLRFPLDKISEKDIENIIDDAIRKAVKDKLSELGISDPAKAFSNKDNLPVLRKKDGTIANVIKSVRLKFNQYTVQVGKGRRARNVKPGNNHHMEIVAVLDDKGNEVKWEGYPVTLLEARRRMLSGEPVVRKDFGPRKLFKFSLSCGEIVRMNSREGGDQLYVIRSVPQSKQMSLVQINDARKLKDIKHSPTKLLTAYPDTLRKNSCIKLSITPLGELRTAND